MWSVVTGILTAAIQTVCTGIHSALCICAPARRWLPEDAPHQLGPTPPTPPHQISPGPRPRIESPGKWGHLRIAACITSNYNFAAYELDASCCLSSIDSAHGTSSFAATPFMLEALRLILSTSCSRQRTHAPVNAPPCPDITRFLQAWTKCWTSCQPTRRAGGQETPRGQGDPQAPGRLAGGAREVAAPAARSSVCARRRAGRAAQCRGAGGAAGHAAADRPAPSLAGCPGCRWPGAPADLWRCGANLTRL